MKLAKTLAILSFAITITTAAYSQTWVSASGSDSGSCTVTAPCKTFAYAVTQTPVWGQLGVLTRGDYGPVTITQSITIDGGGLAANVATTGSAITVQVASGSVVQLHNLSIHGNGASNGIYFASSGQLQIDHLQITGFGTCVNMFESGTNSADLVVKDTSIDNCGAYGIYIVPAASSSPVVSAKIIDTHIHFANHALYVTTGVVSVFGSTFSSPGQPGPSTVGVQSEGSHILLDNCQVSGFHWGVMVGLTTPGYVQLNRSSFVDNYYAGEYETGQLISNGNNSFFDNTFAPFISGTVALQ